MLAEKLSGAVGNASTPVYIEDLFSTYVYTGNGTAQEISNGINLDGRFVTSNIASVRNTESYSTIYAQGKYITCSGNRILTSTDGATWSISSSSPSGGYGNIAFNGTSEYMFVSGANGYCYTSTDLVNWTSIGTRGVIPTAFSAIGTTYVEFGVLSGTSTKAAYYSSNSGASWTSFSNIFTSYNENPGLLKLVNGILFACRSGGTNVKLASSTNGTTWTDRSSGISGAYAIYDITYGNGKYVAIDYAGNYYYSTDLSSWTLVSGAGGSVGNIGFFNGYFVSAGVDSTYSYKIKTSTDGSTWTQIGGMASVQSDSSNGMTCADGSAGVMFVTQIARNSVCVDPSQAVKNGLVWVKSRNNATSHAIVDTVRGIKQTLSTNSGNPSSGSFPTVTGFTNNGFTVGDDNWANYSGYTYASWVFRKQPKFFDVVTWTGNDTSRQISHSLGSVPGCILVKRYDGSGAYSWIVWHRAYNSGNGYAYLNATSAFATDNGLWWGNGSTYTAPTSTNFTISGEPAINQSGVNYVAYIFAHDAGGFGLTGTDNVISCGSFTTNGSGEATVNLGYEPQWFMVKDTNNAGNWIVVDTMRGAPVDPSATLLAASLRPNLSNAESTQWAYPTSTGFFSSGTSSATYIYIAIRKGPMKVPTDATKVFAPDLGSSSGTLTYDSNFVVDFAIDKSRTVSPSSARAVDRLRGAFQLLTPTTDAESSSNVLWDSNTNLRFNSSGDFSTRIGWLFGRAPNFMDVVCYTGNGASTYNINHNLGVTPEMLIIKDRSSAVHWSVYLPNADTFMTLSAVNGKQNGSPLPSAVTSTTFNVGSTTGYASVAGRENTSGDTYVAYLFATCPGVSKVGSYTGNGTSQTINCGFTAGARFVLIKRTDTTGNWYVWDTARGIVSGNDSHLSLNTTDAEVTSNDTIDPDSSGFIVNQVTATNVNVSSATYIFFAVA